MSEALQRAKGIVDAANWFRDKPERWIVHEAADGSLSIATPLENGHLRIIDLNDPKVAAHVAMAGPETVSALLDAVATAKDTLDVVEEIGAALPRLKGAVARVEALLSREEGQT